MVKGQGLLRQQEGGGNGAGKVHHRRHKQCGCDDASMMRRTSVVDGQTYMYVRCTYAYVSVSARSAPGRGPSARPIRDRGTGIITA